MKIFNRQALIIALALAFVIAVILPLTSYSKDSITVTFDTDGGTEIPPVVLVDNQSLAGAGEIPEDPVKDGYTFMGWYPSNEFVSYQRYGEWSFHEIYDDDITLYALFVPNEKIIQNVNLNVDSPVVGDVVTVIEHTDDAYWEEANIIPTVTIADENPYYEVSYSMWVEPSEGYYEAFKGEFAEGESYYATITVDVLEGSGCYFADDLNVTVNREQIVEIEHRSIDWANIIALVPSTTERPEPIEEEQELPVFEPVENTELDKAAAEAINDLVKEIADGKEVPGVSEELINTIGEAFENGKDISVTVRTAEVKKEDVKDDAKKIEEKLESKGTIAALFDIDVVVMVEGKEVGTVTDTGKALTLTLPIPENLPAVPSGYTRVFTVCKVHDGVATKLDTTKSGNNLSTKSSEFSTYAITYEDVKNTSEEIATTNENTTTETAVETTSSNNPKTGDNIAIWISLMVLSILGIAGIVKFVKKNK